MKNEFVKTKNVKIFYEGLTALSNRGAREACLMVVDGKPGLGKTHALNWWACRNDCIYIRAKKNWTPNWLMKDLITSLGEHPAFSFEKMFQQALNLLGQRASDAERDGRVFAVVIDEIDYICRSAKMLETLRDLSDFLEIPFILLGMGVVRHYLGNFPQIASRIGQYISFSPLDFEDTKLLVQKLCDAKVDDRLVEFILNVTHGFVREIKEAIASIDNFYKRNPGIETVTLELMEGQRLMYSRKDSAPILVRG